MKTWQITLIELLTTWIGKWVSKKKESAQKPPVEKPVDENKENVV